MKQFEYTFASTECTIEDLNEYGQRGYEIVAMDKDRFIMKREKQANDPEVRGPLLKNVLLEIKMGSILVEDKLAAFLAYSDRNGIVYLMDCMNYAFRRGGDFVQAIDRIMEYYERKELEMMQNSLVTAEPEDFDGLTIEEAERERIKKALEKNGGNRKCAAADLGISERTLYRKMKEYDL